MARRPWRKDFRTRRCVGLPTATWSLKNFSVDEYKALFEDVKSGKVAISNSTEAAPDVKISVDYQE